MTEERPIFGYEDSYRINRDGRVRSLDRTIHDRLGNQHYQPGRELRTRTAKDGGKTVVLYRDNSHQRYNIAALLAVTFPNRSESIEEQQS